MAIFINGFDKQMHAIANEPSCICCLNKDTKMVKLTTCNHTGILELFTTLKLEYEESYVCYICHHMLEKFDKFKKQVQDSLFAMKQKLWDRTEQSILNKYTISEQELCNYDGNSTEIQQNQTEKEQFTKPLPNVEMNTASNQEGLTLYANEVDWDNEDNTTVKMEMDIKEEKVESTVCEVELSGSQEKAGSSVEDTLKDQTSSMGQKKIVVNPLRVKYITLTESEALAEIAEKRKQRGYELATYRCETCIMAFHHEQYLQKHVDSKHSQNLGDEVCKVCQCVFETRTALIEHLKKHYNRYECLDCSQRFSQYNTAQRHYNDCHSVDKEVYTCAKCDFNTKSYAELRHHREQHDSGTNTCTFCDSSFSAKRALKRHMLTFHMDTRLQNGDKKNRCQNALVGHMKTQHMDGEPAPEFYCSECNIHFKTKECFRSHLENCDLARVETKKRRVICDYCKQTFASKYRLEAHITKHNAELAKKLSYCAICKIQYKNIYIYRSHLKNTAKHVQDGWTCSVCNKTFASKVYWKKHYDFFHLKKSEFKCEQCNKIFISYWRLKIHNQTQHGEERPKNHSCNICEKNFFTTTTLRAHKLTHSEQRSYMCSECGDTFKQRPALYNHTRLVHKGYTRNTKNDG